jgi:precorrin-6A synthase
MTIRVLVIGIGTGNLDHLTREAILALNEVDVFLVADKGPAKRDLAALRIAICVAFIDHDHYRIIEVPDPERDRSAGDYQGAVRDWHAARTEAYADVIRERLGMVGTVGFLVWGDPALYDSTIRIVESLADFGLDVDLRVIPGISSVQVLAARHKIVLNQIGGSIQVTTGRRLLAEYDPALGDFVVMLDGDLACAGLVDRHPELQIFWGAQLGLPSERLVSGRLADVVEEIRAVRAELRERHGWVMDTYLLRTAGPLFAALAHRA